MTISKGAEARQHRLSRVPQRHEVPVEERGDYDVVMNTWIPIARKDESEILPGGVSSLEHFEALAATPTVFLAIMEACEAVMIQQGRKGTISRADHELIDQVLAIDSGYYGLVGWHTPAAVAEGVRIEALEALADGREEQLTDDERLKVGFIRTVRDGGMTDDLWNRVLEALGSERGVVDYATMVLLLLFHHRFGWATGVKEMDHAAWRGMLAGFRAGDRPIPSGPTYAPVRPRNHPAEASDSRDTR